MLQIPEFRRAWGHSSYSAEDKLKGEQHPSPAPLSPCSCHACDTQVANILARLGSNIDKEKIL